MEPIEASLKVTYRALLARGLEAGEAANLTAFLHGLPNAGFRWTLPEIEAIVVRRMAYAARQRTGVVSATAVPAERQGRSTIHDRRHSRAGSTNVIGSAQALISPASEDLLPSARASRNGARSPPGAVPIPGRIRSTPCSARSSAS